MKGINNVFQLCAYILKHPANIQKHPHQQGCHFMQSLAKTTFTNHCRSHVADDKAQRLSLVKGLTFLFSNISFWIIFFYFSIPSLPGWGVKNWLPTFFSNNLGIKMSSAGPLSTITIAASSLPGVIFGGILSDKWVQRNVKGRIFTSAIGLGLTIPALLLVGFGHSVSHVIGAAFCFGSGFGMFDANNMPILCQFVSSKYRATAYGVMNMGGVFSGAFITDWLGKSTDAGHLGRDFAMLAGIVVLALMIQLFFLRPKVNDYDELSRSNGH